MKLENNKIMNIVVLVGSPRPDGNTTLLAKAFAEGAAMRHHVEIVPVANYDVRPCTGCNYCFTSPENACVQKDDMGEIYAKLAHADMLVVATPVYFYGISAQLKTVIDRLHNPMRDKFHIQKMALLANGAASLPELFDAIETQYQLCLNFFHIEDAGRILVRRMHNKGDILQTDALQQARKLGESL